MQFHIASLNVMVLTFTANDEFPSPASGTVMLISDNSRDALVLLMVKLNASYPELAVQLSSPVVSSSRKTLLTLAVLGMLPAGGVIAR